MHYKLFKIDSRKKFGKAYLQFTCNAFVGVKTKYTSYEDKATLFNSEDYKEQFVLEYIGNFKKDAFYKHVIGIHYLYIGKTITGNLYIKDLPSIHLSVNK